MNDRILVLEKVWKSFGSRCILDIMGLELGSGESYVLTGENGSGKTTLLRVIAGLEPAEVEGCRFQGKPVSLDIYPAWLRQQVIYVHQHPYLFRGSIADNIAFGLRARGLTVSECRQLVDEAIEWAGVGELLSIPSHKLSGGEKQRVALARARVLKPRLFLLDEPTANLDADGRQQVIRLIRDLCISNSTVLLACHDREIIELPHMHRLHLDQGRLEARVPEVELSS